MGGAGAGGLRLFLCFRWQARRHIFTYRINLISRQNRVHGRHFDTALNNAYPDRFDINQTINRRRSASDTLTRRAMTGCTIDRIDRPTCIQNSLVKDGSDEIPLIVYGGL